MTIVCWLVTHGIHTGSTQFDTVEALRILAIYVMPIWLLTFPEAVPHRLLMVLAVGSTVVGGILALSGPPVYLNATRPSLATFTAGPTMIHASALFIASQLILINEYRRARMLPGRFAWPTMLFALLILNGYTGRNEMAYVGAYFAVLGYFRFRHVPAVKWSLPILLVAFVIASAFALSFVQDIQSWGSGRIGTWQYRLGIIWSRDFLTFLFGGGMRSDWIWSPQWWFFFEAVQNAHNDYLHIMMESGLLGLIATLVFLAALLMQLPGDSKSTLIALAVTSFFANTYFQSPLIAMNLLMPAPVALYCWHLRHGQGRRDAP
jgi:O-antigen ligase